MFGEQACPPSTAAAQRPSRPSGLDSRGKPGTAPGHGHGSVVPLRLDERPRVSVVVADDHPVVRQGLRALHDATDAITVVGESAAGRGALNEVLLHRPDVLIMDVEGAFDGVAVIRDVVRSVAGVGVLVFTMVEDDETVLAAIRAGARGYVHKCAQPEDILLAVRGVAAGQAVFGPRIAGRLAELLAVGVGAPSMPFPQLTSRERQVLDLVAAGAGNSAIAHRLQLAPKTIANHVSAIFAKLQVTDRAEAVIQARDAGLGRVSG